MKTYVLNPAREAQYETYELESNPRRMPHRNRFGEFTRGGGVHHNPSRRRRHRRARHHRNPTSYALNPVRHRYSATRRHHYRRNPSMEQITGGVGLASVVGTGAGFVAASEGPLMFGLSGWKNVAAAAAIAVIGGKALEGLMNRAAGIGFIAGGLANAGLKAAGIMTNGQFGIAAGSPEMHNVFGPASRQAMAAHRAGMRAIGGGAAAPTFRALPMAGAAVQSAPYRLRSASGI